jgi:hypothetical protein
MKSSKTLTWLAVILLGGIIIVGLSRKIISDPSEVNVTVAKPLEIDFEKTTPSKESPVIAKQEQNLPKETSISSLDTPPTQKTPPKPATVDKSKEHISKETSHVNRISQLFSKGEDKLPFMETIKYRSKVSWLKGRPAWLVDYASHYQTSSYFISRSLTGKEDYFTQSYSNGDRFNVFKKGVDVSFHLLVDLKEKIMWFYYLNQASGERLLLRTYPVGLGREDSTSSSGYLTPTGKYSLGDRTAIYKPGVKGIFRSKPVEMIRVFGTRWIPFEKEISNCSAPAKGFGIHGAPWEVKSGKLEEDIRSIQYYESDGCIRLEKKDIEELFAIIITKPTTIEIVPNFSLAQLPGEEIVL